MPNEYHEVLVTGLGPVTAVGVGCGALWSSLRDGRSQVSLRELQVDLARVETLPIASMPDEEAVPGLGPHLGFLTEQELIGYRDLAYTLLAMELALEDAGFRYDRSENRVGMVQSFEAPGVEQTVGRLFGMMSAPLPSGGHGPPPVYDLLAPSFYAMQPFMYVHLAGKAFGLHGFCTSVHHACSSGAYALEVAVQQIRCGVADAMLVVGGEAFDTAVRLEWFRRLELYAQEPVMRPFGAEASGFYVGEGAGAILLESETSVEQRGGKVYGRYLGGSFCHQAWKQTVPDVRAGRLREVVERAVCDNGLSFSELDLIVPHGAATGLSDRYESECIGQAMGGEGARAVAAAFKPYVGHTLAACGILETLCGLLALRHGVIPATLSSDESEARFPCPMPSKPVEKELRTMLKVSTGFTGHDAALVFQRV